DRVEILNANNPNGSGPISISNFRPFPKNPIISKFFVQIGRVEELGSGIINVNKYLKYYSPGSRPEFIEDSVFKTIIPVKLTVSVSDVISATDVVTVEINDSLNKAISEALNDGINEGIIEGINEGIKNRIVKTVAEIKENEGIKAKVLADRIGVSIQTIERDISLIKSLALVEYKGSKKLGGYYLTDNLKGKLAQ
ncbi:MAG: HTH domain-containing protein, partial [Ignavibacteria bacterium]|nr:HTH domain-containing protein [Ignavibacteria bacterium]